MSNKVDLDKLYLALGQWGPYQRRQLITLLIALLSTSFHMLSIVFIAYRPSFHCKLEGNISLQANAAVVEIYAKYHQCSITYSSNSSDHMSVEKTESECKNGWIYDENGVEFSNDRSIISEWNLVCSRNGLAELSQTLVMIGQGIGAFVFPGLADKYGRKPTHVLCHCMLFIVTLATAFAPNYTAFAAFRMLTGGLQQGTALTLVILNLEMLPTKTRAYVEVFGLLFWSTGIAIITPIAYILKDKSWRYFQICLACMSSWALIEWWLVDESLHWLIANGRTKDARTIIMKACRLNKKNFDTVSSESGFNRFEMKTTTETIVEANQELLSEADEMRINGMSSSGLTAQVKSYTILDLVKSRRLLMTSLIIWFAWATNNLTYYGLMMISSTLAGNRFLNFFLGSIVEYPAALCEWYMLNRYGRKATSMFFHVVCGLSLILATVLVTSTGDNESFMVASTVFTLIGKFAITGSWSTLFLYTPELYPTNLRNVGIGIASAASRIGGMISPFSRNLADAVAWGPGLVFGIMCAVVSVSLLWVPETNQYELPQTIEECEDWYRQNQLQLRCCHRKDSNVCVEKGTSEEDAQDKK